MKNKLLFSIFTFFTFQGFAQTSGNYFSGTIKHGSMSNSVYIVIKSNTTISGASFSTVQFELGIPTSVGTRPDATITSLIPGITYSKDGATETQGATDYYGFGFSGDGPSAAADYTAGIEDTIAEVFFTATYSQSAVEVRMMQLPNGGTTGNVNFYLADRGFDVTNQTAQFYSNISSNYSNDGNGYAGSSYVLSTADILNTTPVTLSSFNATLKNNSAILSWAVENQDANSSHFEIERSLNGTDFSPVGTVQASSASQGNYSYADNASTLFGTVYYRLKMVDKNGAFVYSDIKSVQFKNAAFAVTLYPNPVHDVAKLNVTLDESQLIKVFVSDAMGKSVQQFEMNGQKGFNEKTLNLSNLPTGSYMVRIQAGANSKTISLIKN
ncbi:MAG: T9SS type A sorting domain-containing protein [Ginsengibacter sp.]